MALEPLLLVTIITTPTRDIARQKDWSGVSLSLRNMRPKRAVKRGMMFMIRDIRTRGNTLITIICTEKATKPNHTLMFRSFASALEISSHMTFLVFVLVMSN